MSNRIDVERKLQRVLRRQHGLVTTAQALESGLSYQGIGRRQAAGRLDRVRRGVLRDPGQPVTQQQRILAAVLSNRSPTYASGPSAAYLYGNERHRGGNIYLAVEGTARHTNAFASVERIDGLDHRDHRRVDGIPCLSPELALLTLAKRSSFDDVELDMVDLVCRGLVTPARVLRALERFEGRGRNGIVLLRQVAQHWDGRALPGSPKELELGRILDASGVGPVTYQVPVTVDGGITLHADIGLPGRPVVVEYQSDVHHSTRKARRNDSTRILRMRAAGLEVLPATQNDIDNGGRDLVAAVRAIDLGRAA